ncbi:kinesin-like protein KIN-7E [Tanacetum coccineum]
MVRLSGPVWLIDEKKNEVLRGIVMINSAINYVAVSNALAVSPSVIAAGVAADNVICPANSFDSGSGDNAPVLQTATALAVSFAICKGATHFPLSSSEQIAPETSKVKASRKKNIVNGPTKAGPTSAPASSNEQIAPETTPGPGTASVVLAGLISALKLVGRSLANHKFLFLGAGESIRPTVLIGSSRAGQTFTKDVVEAMASFHISHLKLADGEIEMSLSGTSHHQEESNDICKVVRCVETDESTNDHIASESTDISNGETYSVSGHGERNHFQNWVNIGSLEQNFQDLQNTLNSLVEPPYVDEEPEVQSQVSNLTSFKLTKSRSCIPNLMISSSLSEFDNTPPNDFETGFTGRPKIGNHMKLWDLPSSEFSGALAESC